MVMLEKRASLFLLLCLAFVPASYAEGDRRPMISQALTPTDQLSGSVVVRDVTVQDSTVSGVVVNNSGRRLRNVQLLIRYGWMWGNEFRPGANEPSRAFYYTVPGEIPAGGSVPFTYRPESPLLYRADGRFITSVQVVSFTQFEGVVQQR